MHATPIMTDVSHAAPKKAGNDISTGKAGFHKLLLPTSNHSLARERSDASQECIQFQDECPANSAETAKYLATAGSATRKAKSCVDAARLPLEMPQIVGLAPGPFEKTMTAALREEHSSNGRDEMPGKAESLPRAMRLNHHPKSEAAVEARGNLLTTDQSKADTQYSSKLGQNPDHYVQRDGGAVARPQDISVQDIQSSLSSAASIDTASGAGALGRAYGGTSATHSLAQALAPEAIQFHAAPQGAMKFLKFTLTPEHLGSVDVCMRKTGDGLSISILADSQEAVSLLQSDEASLRKLLESAGLENPVSLYTIECRTPSPADKSTIPGQSAFELSAGARDGSATSGTFGDPGRHEHSQRKSPGGSEEHDGINAASHNDSGVSPARRGLYL